MSDEVVDALWKFSADMFELLCRVNVGSNVFLSPLSIMSALGMTLAGARGATAQEVASCLHVESLVGRGDEAGGGVGVHKQLGRVMRGVQCSSEDGGVRSSVANRMFVERSFEVLESFRRVLSDHYGSSHGEVDFKSNAAGAVEEINSWVEKETNNKIRKLVSTDAINSLTRVVLVNAIHFKGMWKNSFTKTETSQQPFHVTAAEEMKVQMMRMSNTTHGYSFNPDLGCHCVRLPFRDAHYAMFLLVPKEKHGLAEVEKRLASSRDLLRQTIQGCRNRKIDLLMLPRFELTCQFDLNESLPQLGVKQLFDENLCDLSGVSGGRDLVVSKVIHKAFLEVNEEGAEAAAATAVVMQFRCARPMPVERLEVIADHPFMVTICHENRPLFVGRISRPDSK